MPRTRAKPAISPNARTLLAWYDRHRRRLPWRAAPGKTADPYAVWLSEIMLQQTTVAAVKPYFETFLRRWPTVAALAAAPVSDVMAAWAGLGYYARARNLHACAKAVTDSCGGHFPDTVEGLRALPGIGPYTAAAVAAIAFNRKATVVDGNVERVMARVFAVTEPLPKAKPRLLALATELTPARRAGDYAQAVMDLGATVCTPKSPACDLCPWARACLGRDRGIAATLPRKTAKAPTPIRHGVAFWMMRHDGAVLLRRRPARGLLGGMMEIPSTPWRATPWTAPEAAPASPAPISPKMWRLLPGAVSHTFTHFHLHLQVIAVDLSARRAAALAGDDLSWVPVTRIGDAGLPSVMAKVARHALVHAG
ncbi:MAG: A/G-specific adenine glycosylase [Rhodospirillaceae bacterium]|nr:MAG: A/G-specific adenine glycosylase [Rhodospirillaceae bacterium]